MKVFTACLGMLFFLSFSVFSQDGGKHFCHQAEPWKITVCGTSDEKLNFKTDVLDFLLKNSLLKKTTVPQPVLRAARSVFSFRVPNRFGKWSWNSQGGSGFFILNNTTFITNHHVLFGLLNRVGISRWDEISFRDQAGKKRPFRIRGVKFVSIQHDLAVLEVEGYEGPVLKPADLPPGGQSYLMGYPKSGNDDVFKIYSVRSPFELGAAHYGAFMELFDCYYDFGQYSGASGGPMLNQNGEVEGVFFAVLQNFPGCVSPLIKRWSAFSRHIKTNGKVYRSLSEVQALMDEDTRQFLDREIRAEDSESRFLLAFTDMLRIDIADRLLVSAVLSHHPAAQHLMLDVFNGNPSYPLAVKTVLQMMARAEKQLSPGIYYGMGFLYYGYGDRDTACQFWEKARRSGHPYTYSNAVLVPSMEQVILCGYSP